MSNYPPTPSFGGPFNFAAQWPPPQPPPMNGQAHSHSPRNQPGPETQSLPRPPFPPLLPHDLQALYNANASSFAANAQLHYLKEGHYLPGHLPPSFPYPPPFASSSLPHPPFPPVPVPVPPGFHQSQPPATQSYAPPTLQPAHTFQPETLAETSPTENASVGNLSTGEDIDREEGELSEGEFEEDIDSKEVDTPISGRVSPAMGQKWTKVKPDDKNAPPAQNSGGLDNTDPNLQLHRELLSTAVQHVNGAHSSSILHSKPVSEHGSRSFIPSPPSEMPGIQQPNLSFTGTSKEPISTEMEATSGSLEQPSTTANPTQLKKQAMGALLSLFPHNIRYDELVQEGIDPVVLRKLYDEIGVKVVSSSPHAGVNVQQTTPPLFDFVGPNLLSTTSVSTSSQPLDISAAQSAPQNSMAKTQDIVEIATRPDTRTTQSLSKLPTMDPIGPNESRSAYIARMVAARTAKPTAVASLPEPTSVASNSSLQTPSTAQSQQESATSRGEEQEGPSQLDVEVQVKEKNKAQTELAKQKMEQLKQQARLSKAAAQQPPVDSPSLPASTSNLPSIPRNYPQPGGFLPSESLPPRPEPRQYHQAGVESLPSLPPPRPISPRTPRLQVHSTTQHALTDTTERQRSVFQIPGLFMTGPDLAPPQTVESPSPPRAVESPPLLQAVELQPPPSSFYQWLEYRQSIVHSNLAAQSSPGTSAATQAPSNALMEPVQELSTLEHLSTPDFNEEPGPGSKRPFGKDREIPVQFDISEDEMAYDNEGSDMEMDDSTDEEESELHPTANETTQATTVNDAPTHIDLPARKPYLPSSSIMTPPIASTPQTPGKGNDREDLRRKDQQIEEMKRKIKEMEMRRKAKQQSSRTQTPSAPNLPAVLPEDTNAAQNADAIASPAEGRRLYIGNLARTTTEDDVKDFFKGYSVESCSIPASPRTHRPAGHAFVDLTTAPEAHRAISELSGKEMLDRKVLIQFARIPAEKNEASSGEGSVGEGQRAQTPPEIQPKDVDSTVAPSGTYSSPAATNSQQVIEDQVRPSLAFQHVPVEPQISSPIPSKRPGMDSSAMSSSPMRQLDPVKAQQIEMKRKRKAELESGLPILDAEVERARSKLDQMRREMERMEEEIRKGLEGRKLLVQELEALGIETEGIPTDELQAKMDQIVEEQNLAQNTLPVPEDVIPFQISQSFPRQTDSEALSNSTPLHGIDDLHSGQDLPDMFEQVGVDNSDSIASLESNRDVIHILSSSDSGAEEGQIDSDEMVLHEVQQENHYFDSGEDFEADSHGATLHEQPQDELDSGDDAAMSLDDSPVEDSPNLNTEVSDGDCESTSPEPVRPKSSAEDDSQGFSRESSTESQGIQDIIHIDSSHEPDPSESDNEPVDDVYEPPEVTTGVESEANEQMGSPPFSPAPPETSASEPAFDLQTVDDSVSGPPRASSAFEQSRPVFPPQVRPQSSHFTPYQSPLRHFNNYRFHPDYTANVQGGFQSLTYSSNIDPKNPVCIYESSGGICNDPSCDSQHFRQMHMSDSAILAQLGNIREGTTPEEQQQYVDGLKQIIAGLRHNKARDLTTIASEITGYRRRFLQDPSRVLAL